jgi:hypothetical protein
MYHKENVESCTVRNRYFYGKLLDVFHFEMEQEYFNSKRWLLNRRIIGYGVVCGLDVVFTENCKGVIVQPGFAIDRCGHEIIVPKSSAQIPFPDLPPPKQSQTQEQGQYERPDRCEDEYFHIVLCYHECESGPVPVMTSECDTASPCASGSIREQYEVHLRPGVAPERKKTILDVIDRGRLNHSALVEYVTRACPPMPKDCCIPLANIRLVHTDKGWDPRIDITIRPIVVSNWMLFDLIRALVEKEQPD